MNTPVHQAALEYMAGAKIRAEKAELSDRSLARKFECGTTTICRVRAHLEVRALSEAEQRLIRQCIQERARLEGEALKYTKPYLSKKHGVSVRAINAELARLNFTNPLEARKSSPSCNHRYLQVAV